MFHLTNNFLVFLCCYCSYKQRGKIKQSKEKRLRHRFCLHSQNIIYRWQFWSLVFKSFILKSYTFKMRSNSSYSLKATSLIYTIYYSCQISAHRKRGSLEDIRVRSRVPMFLPPESLANWHFPGCQERLFSPLTLSLAMHHASLVISGNVIVSANCRDMWHHF